jgi:hypothetical protein
MHVRSPLKFNGEASPLVKKPANVVDCLPPFHIRNGHRLLDLQSRPAIEIGFRHDTLVCTVDLSHTAGNLRISS